MLKGFLLCLQELYGLTEYRGTGISLSIVRKVTENHIGYITAESKPGVGSVFKNYLPKEIKEGIQFY